MKALLKTSALALLLISLFTTSCEKAKIAAIITPMGFTSTSNTPGNNNPTVVTGNAVEVAVDAMVRIEPKISDEWKKCNGTWTMTVEGAWTNDDYSCGKDEHTGVLNFIAKKPGVFKIKFKYTCPDGSFTSATITVTAR